MLPRRCKSCRCYVAPQLHRCPRCNKVAPPLKTAKATKEDRRTAREKADQKVPHVHAKNMVWVPSAFSLAAHRQSLEECRRRLAKADSPRARNAIRSEIRVINRHLARAIVKNGAKPWTTEMFRTKHANVSVFVSPKGHRYILADKDAPADLIIIARKKDRGLPPTRLQRFERSKLARAIKKAQSDDRTHAKRKKAKKVQRSKRRALTKRTRTE